MVPVSQAAVGRAVDFCVVVADENAKMQAATRAV
jgi:hypothetical protein